jgi:glycosyltransferase involved in cell wall biosynthesis
LIGSWYAKLKKIPAIIIEHGTGHIDFENSLINIIAATYEHVITYFIKLTSLKFYGVSKACTQWLLHFGIQPSGVIYNGVDTSYQLKTFLRYRSIHNLPKNAIVITFVGRLIVEKGVLELIEAVKSLLHAYKNLYLMIAGDGPLKSRINKLPKRIIYLGRVEHDNVMGLLSETDILVLPSRFPEGLPTILLEAGSIGCAVIATPKGGTKEVITDERFGIIIDNNEILTIRKALISLINNPEKRADLAENLRKRIRENFDWEIIFNRLINEVINNGIKA